MIFRKLFTKQNDVNAIALHSNPFENIEMAGNQDVLPLEFTTKWVKPFYMGFLSPKEERFSAAKDAAKEITPDLVKILLENFNWRTLTTGAYFAAVNRYIEFEDTIGTLLLKSNFCYAGAACCIALASFGTEKSIDYLKQYLDYYLERKNLAHDQPEALCALWYLDKNAAIGYQDRWGKFVANRPGWNLEEYKKQFNQSMEHLERIRQSSN
jgi:hypothetical protein